MGIALIIFVTTLAVVVLAITDIKNTTLEKQYLNLQIRNLILLSGLFAVAIANLLDVL